MTINITRNELFYTDILNNDSRVHDKTIRSIQGIRSVKQRGAGEAVNKNRTTDLQAGPGANLWTRFKFFFLVLTYGSKIVERSHKLKIKVLYH